MTAWTGIAVGGALGGALGFVVSRAVFKHGDLGVTVASAAAFALIGGALTAPKPQDQVQPQANATT